MKKLLSFLADNAWTYAGTGMVLITLSGPTLRQALLMTGVALVVHAAITLGSNE